MGFVGDGSNIAIVTAIPLLISDIKCVYIFNSLGYLFILFFHGALRFPDVETNPGSLVLFLVLAKHSACSNERGIS